MSSNHTIKAKDNNIVLELERDTIDVCSDNKRVQLRIKCDPIVASDEFFGYDLQILYDHEVLVLDKALQIGTVSHGADEFITNYESGEIRVACVNMGMQPLVGSNYLLAIEGTLISECETEGIIRLGYVEATQEYKDDFVIENEDIVQYARIAKEDDRKYIVRCNPNDASFEKNDSLMLTVSNKVSDGNRVTDVTLKIENNDDLLIIDNIYNLNEEYEIKYDSGEKKVHISSSDEIETTELFDILVIRKENIDFNSEITITPTITNKECSCISEVNGFTIPVESKKNPDFDKKNNIVLELEQDTIDICSENKRVLLKIKCDTVLASDELFGYDLQILYDPEVMNLNKALRINTVSEGADKFIPSYENGKVRIACVNMGVAPLAGENILVAIEGEFISDCQTEDIIKLDYLEATEEYKDMFVFENTEVTQFGRIAKEQDRKYELNCSQDTLQFYKKDSLMMTINNMVAEGNRVKDVSISIENSENIVIDNIYNLNKKYEAVYDEEEKTVNITCEEEFETGKLFDILVIRKENKDFNGIISIVPTVNNRECSCIIEENELSVPVKSQEYSDIDNNEDDADNIYYSSMTKTLVNKTGKLIRELYLTDINGRILNRDSDVIGNKEIETQSNGIYVVHLLFENGERKIVLINN